MGSEVAIVDVRVMVELHSPVSADDAFRRVESLLRAGADVEQVVRLSPEVASAHVVRPTVVVDDGVDPNAPVALAESDFEQAQLGPFVRDSETSREAAIQNYPRRGTQLRTVFEAVVAAGIRGRTRDELHAELVGTGKGIAEGALDARVWELGPRKAGWLVPNGEKRPTPTGAMAEVLVVSPLGWRRWTEEHGA